MRGLNQVIHLEIDRVSPSSPISDAEDLCYGAPVSANHRWSLLVKD